MPRCGRVRSAGLAVVAAFGGVLHKLYQNTRGAFGVDERDFCSAVADFGLLIDELCAVGFELGEGGVDVFDFDADVVQPFAAFFEKLRDTAFGGCGLHQLDACVADGHDGDADVLVFDFFDGAAGEAPGGFPEGFCLFQVADDDCDVIDFVECHDKAPMMSGCNSLAALVCSRATKGNTRCRS